MLITGTRTEIDAAAAQLGGPIDPVNTSRILQVPEDAPGRPQITAALTRLADHLARNPPPIGYRRRRTLDYTNLLPEQEWVAICRATGAFRGKGRKPLIARAYLFNRLSGLPLEFAPAIPTAKDNFLRNSVAEFATNRFPEPAAGLDQAAHDFLARHGITDEPVARQPPLTLVGGLDVSGPDPGNINVSELHRLLLAGRSPRKAAADLDTTPTAVRCVLEEHPPQPGASAEDKAPCPAPAPVPSSTSPRTNRPASTWKRTCRSRRSPYALAPTGTPFASWPITTASPPGTAAVPRPRSPASGSTSSTSSTAAPSSNSPRASASAPPP
ncbi:hypothetical protein GCM10027160_03250 [Streptomyces calidiresistens]|uniref:hypothetical protein n=1 Tax=Streptomyces calidiresistens TaxID=1485586 RepID=UPI001E462D11|nr:hypothetical protein [Streptomyces calidiresistens]